MWEQRIEADRSIPRYVDLITESTLGDASGDFWPDSIALLRVRWQHIREFRVRGLDCAITRFAGILTCTSVHLSPPVFLPLFLPSAPTGSTDTPIDRSREFPRGYLPFSVAGLDSTANNNEWIIGDDSAIEQHDRSCIIKIAWCVRSWMANSWYEAIIINSTF